VKKLQEILAKLVGIDSSSALSNAPMIAALTPALEALGFTLRRHGYLDETGVEKLNLVASWGEPARPALALVGHTDCVPYDPAWAGALRLEERDGKLFGRGACDTKGFLACMLAAASRVDRSALTKGLALVFTADEETGCLGARKLSDAKLVAPSFAIVGEPTELTPVRAHKGYSLAKIEVIGREGHSAYPASGASAILAASRLLARIDDLAKAFSQETDPEFDPPFLTVNVGTITGGKAANIIPGSCRFSLEWRTLPTESPGRFLDAVRALGHEIARERGVEVRVRQTRSDRGVSTPRESPLVRFLEEQSGKTAAAVSFGTEATHLTEMGAQSVVFGAGDIHVAHRTGEFVPAADLERCAQVLTAAIEHFCRDPVADHPSAASPTGPHSPAPSPRAGKG
jgi:acetylornithine deacetylase